MFAELSAISLGLLLLALFFSGFIDAIAGGGGLVQSPALLLTFPNENPVSVVGTSKTAAFFGTTTAALKYRKSIKTDPKLLLAMVIPAFIEESNLFYDDCYIHLHLGKARTWQESTR